MLYEVASACGVNASSRVLDVGSEEAFIAAR